jgi:lipopolysaccharide transport system ATP-binding protein
MQDRIVVRELGKKFRRYSARRPSRLKQALTGGFRKSRPIEEFWGLRHLSVSVAAGRMVGIIGHNGAGKSTLLRLIGGVGKPDEGFVTIRGRIGALLDLGAGCHPDLSGRDNVFLSGVVAGLTRREVATRFDGIVGFAELEDFIDSPLRTYSSGMQMRLAFAVAVHTNSDILLIDEVLSVGDVAFQKKCLEAIKQRKANGCAILLISHDMNQVRQMCDDVYWLQAGQAVAHGNAAEICTRYTEAMSGAGQGIDTDTPSEARTA